MLKRLQGPLRRVLPRETPRAAGASFGIVVVFAAVAVLLLTLTLVNSLRIRTNIATAITPQLSGVNEHLGGLPALDRTAELTAKIAVAVAPIGAAVSHTRESNDSSAADMDAIRDGVHSIAGSVAGIGDSVTASTSSLRLLAPLVATITLQTGDISKNLGTVRRATTEDADDIADALIDVEHLAYDSAAVHDQLGGIQSRMKRIAAHSENAAAARILELGKRRPMPRRDVAPAGVVRP